MVICSVKELIKLKHTHEPICNCEWNGRFLKGVNCPSRVKHSIDGSEPECFISDTDEEGFYANQQEH